jgi:hypothetical protein
MPIDGGKCLLRSLKLFMYTVTTFLHCSLLRMEAVCNFVCVADNSVLHFTDILEAKFVESATFMSQRVGAQILHERDPPTLIVSFSSRAASLPFAVFSN